MYFLPKRIFLSKNRKQKIEYDFYYNFHFNYSYYLIIIFEKVENNNFCYGKMDHQVKKIIIPKKSAYNVFIHKFTGKTDKKRIYYLNIQNLKNRLKILKLVL